MQLDPNLGQYWQHEWMLPTQANGFGSDITSHYAAARAGVGVAGLAFDGEGFSREIWLVVHRDLKRSPPIRAVMDFLIEVIGSARALQQG